MADEDPTAADPVLSHAELIQWTIELENHANWLAVAAQKLVVELDDPEKKSPLGARQQLRVEDLKERLAFYFKWKKEQADPA